MNTIAKSIQVRLRDAIHDVHKCQWSIAKPKRHHYKFIMSVPNVKGSVMYILFLDLMLLVSKVGIYFGKSSRTHKLVKEVMYPW